MSKIDNINEVSTIDEIKEVEKFNPFHDAQGKFSSSQGFATYSANPKTKAGQMAIGRSYAGGHGRTMNVHRESKGENITQNQNWIQNGIKPTKAQLNRAQLLAPQNPGAKGTVNTTAKPQTQAQAKPKATTAKPQTKPTKTTAPKQQAGSQHTVAQGKDISKTFQYDRSSNLSAVDQACKAQGFYGKPKVVTTKAEWDAAQKASGIRAYRTERDGGGKTGQEWVENFVNTDNFNTGGSGGRWYGGGVYFATNTTQTKGVMPDRSEVKAAWDDSRGYGSRGQRKTITATIDPSANIGDYDTVNRQFFNLSPSTRQKFGNDVGAYAASKGFDALQTDGSWGNRYTIVYNRTKMIVYDDINRPDPDAN